MIKANHEATHGNGTCAAFKIDSEYFIGQMVRTLRERQGKKAIDLAKSAGIDPRTVTAIEKGRIKNPSLHNIQCIAKALNISVADFFMRLESERCENICQGSQKGEFSFDFSEHRVRIISFTPIVPGIFIGKVLMDAHSVMGSEELRLDGFIFIQLIFGRLMVLAQQKEFHLREGGHFLLNSVLLQSLENPSEHESSFMLVTAPSILNRSGENLS